MTDYIRFVASIYQYHHGGARNPWHPTDANKRALAGLLMGNPLFKMRYPDLAKTMRDPVVVDRVFAEMQEYFCSSQDSWHPRRSRQNDPQQHYQARHPQWNNAQQHQLQYTTDAHGANMTGFLGANPFVFKTFDTSGALSSSWNTNQVQHPSQHNQWSEAFAVPASENQLPQPRAVEQLRQKMEARLPVGGLGLPFQHELTPQPIPQQMPQQIPDQMPQQILQQLLQPIPQQMPHHTLLPQPLHEQQQVRQDGEISVEEATHQILATYPRMQAEYAHILAEAHEKAQREMSLSMTATSLSGLCLSLNDVWQQQSAPYQLWVQPSGSQSGTQPRRQHQRPGLTFAPLSNLTTGEGKLEYDFLLTVGVNIMLARGNLRRSDCVDNRIHPDIMTRCIGVAGDLFKVLPRHVYYPPEYRFLLFRMGWEVLVKKGCIDGEVEDIVKWYRDPEVERRVVGVPHYKKVTMK